MQRLMRTIPLGVALAALVACSYEADIAALDDAFAIAWYEKAAPPGTRTPVARGGAFSRSTPR